MSCPLSGCLLLAVATSTDYESKAGRWGKQQGMTRMQEEVEAVTRTLTQAGLDGNVSEFDARLEHALQALTVEVPRC